jgi:23S rRNA pseudouridine2605 synthase
MDQRRPPRKGGHGPAPRGPRPNDRPRRPQRSAHPTPKDADGGDDRLQKVMAHAGIGSRRACEELILAGRVTVNGKIVRELGTKVDPTGAGVAVDGEKLVAERPVYYAVYKPKGYVSTNADPSGRPRVLDLLPEIPQRVYTVGRLDEMSNGLIILTNDGTLAHKLAHPKYGVEKLYRVVVAGIPTREVLNQMTEGIWLAEGKVRAKRVRAVGKRGESTILEMVLSEGKNREVRRMMAKLGHKVMSLTRIAVGPITIKGLSSGQFRPLTSMEVGLLRKTAAGEYVAPFAYDKKSPRPQRPRPEGDQAGPGRPTATRPGLDRVMAPSSRRPTTDRPSGPSSRRPTTDRPSGPSSRRPRPIARCPGVPNRLARSPVLPDFRPRNVLHRLDVPQWGRLRRVARMNRARPTPVDRRDDLRVPRRAPLGPRRVATIRSVSFRRPARTTRRAGAVA